MKHRLTVLFGGLLLLINGTACSGGVAQYFPRDPSLPMVPARELLLDAEPFPDDWQANPCDTNCEREEGFGDAMRTYGSQDFTRPGRVIQHVRRYRNEWAAAHEYQGYRDTFFQEKPPPQTPSTDFMPPPEITYQSPYANEYYFACGVDIVPACRLVAQYKNYFIYMYLDIEAIHIAGKQYSSSDEGMPLETVEPILRALDERVAAELNLVAPTDMSTEP